MASPQENQDARQRIWTNHVSPGYYVCKALPVWLWLGTPPPGYGRPTGTDLFCALIDSIGMGNEGWQRHRGLWLAALDWPNGKDLLLSSITDYWRAHIGFHKSKKASTIGIEYQHGVPAHKPTFHWVNQHLLSSSGSPPGNSRETIWKGVVHEISNPFERYDEGSLDPPK